jgi:hypothetical protein
VEADNTGAQGSHRAVAPSGDDDDDDDESLSLRIWYGFYNMLIIIRTGSI